MLDEPPIGWVPELMDRIGAARILVVLGEGGVGKTTLAAASALALAMRGERVLAVTVDPSNRLKTSLGLSGPPGNEEPIRLDAVSRTPIRGSLHAMVLDAATELHRLVARLVPDPTARRRIVENVFFGKAAAAMAGTHEYTAMERLLEALESGAYTRVVLDTPPERHALDFLDAPVRLHDLLSSEVFQMFVRASSGVSRLGLQAIRWKTWILKGIGKFAGEETFLAVLDFILAFQPLFDGFRQRTTRVRGLLTGPESATLIVCRPGARSAEGVRATRAALLDRGITPAAVVVNRVHVWPPPGAAAGTATGPLDAAAVKDALWSDPALGLSTREELSDLATRLLVLARQYRDLVERDLADLEVLRRESAPTPVLAVPLLSEEVRDLDGLARFAGIS